MLEVALQALACVFVFLLMAIPGYALKKFNKLSDEGVNTLSFVLSWIAQPFLVLNVFVGKQFNSSESVDLLICLAVSFMAVLVSFALAYLAFNVFYKNDDARCRGSHISSATFMNAGFLGIPLISMLMGSNSAAMVYSAIYLTAFNICFWTIGMYVSSGDKTYVSLKNLLNPTFIALAIGFVLFFTGASMEIPAWLANGISLMGNMATPLCVIVFGAILADNKWSEIFRGGRSWLATLLKLIVSPLVVLALLILLGIDGTIIKVVMLLTMMPTASLCLAMAKLYGGDVKGSLKVQLATTLLCMATVPLLWGLIELLVQVGWIV